MYMLRDIQKEFEDRFQNPQYFSLVEFAIENKLTIEGVEDDTVCYDSPEQMADYCDALLSEGIRNITALETHLQLTYQSLKLDQSNFNVIYQRAVRIKELIKEEQDYLIFVQNKKKAVVKSTRYRAAAERYFILETFGFFNSAEWKNLAIRNKQQWLSEILYCNIDTVKNIMNGKKDYQLGQSNKQKILDKIKQDQKKG